ncbi:small heat shock protein [Phlebopus sp. FC_14]|nr:small heat shock protein [Phlebopus sp. FC_14]
MSSIARFYYDPFTEFDRLFDDAFAARLHIPTTSAVRNRSVNAVQRQGPFTPRLDVHENKEANTVTAAFELPGLSSENVTIDVHDNRLTVSGESENTHAEDEAGYTIRERHYGKFTRTVQLPPGTKPEDVTAKMENGVLTVTFPKVNAEQRAHRIAID